MVFVTSLVATVAAVFPLHKRRKSHPAYKDYVRRTSAFVPWFPRRRTSLTRRTSLSIPTLLP